MKIMTILGTRPEIIRLCRIIEKLDNCSEHILVHTGQNFDRNLNDIFFEQMRIRRPDHMLSTTADTFGQQAGNIMASCEKLLIDLKPDRLLVLGDTNSGLSVIPAKRMGIPVFHMEAGNRCFDDRVPEEVNRRIIDHSSDILLPYTERSRANLLREGMDGKKIFVTGNPILEVIEHYKDDIEKSTILTELELKAKQYIVVTCHRAENVDVEERLHKIIRTLEALHDQYDMPIIVSTHPRTRTRIEQFKFSAKDAVRFLPPFGFADFVRLERDSFCTLTDSGTVQEECCILRVPNVTTRDTTERPETVEAGSGIISGIEPESIIRGVKVAVQRTSSWNPPVEYLAPNVSDAVVNILLSRYGFRAEEAAEKTAAATKSLASSKK